MRRSAVLSLPPLSVFPDGTLKNEFRDGSVVDLGQALTAIDIVSLLNRLLKVCYVPATSTSLPRLLLLLLRPLTALMKQTRQAVLCAAVYIRCIC
jgi:hypothetical protein